jgi:hypothetical protein
VTSLVPRLSPGSTFADRFKILDYVGEGSAGAIYRATPISGGSPVALELVRLDATDGGALRRFEREVERGRSGESPHAAATLDWGKLSDHLAWVAMELAPSVDLDAAPVPVPVLDDDGSALDSTPQGADGAATPDRPALVVTRPGPFVTAVLLSCVAAGLAIYWLLRSMHI